MVKHRFTCGRGTRLQAQKNRRSGRFDGGKGYKKPGSVAGFGGYINAFDLEVAVFSPELKALLHRLAG